MNTKILKYVIKYAKVIHFLFDFMKFFWKNWKSKGRINKSFKKSLESWTKFFALQNTLENFVLLFGFLLKLFWNFFEIGSNIKNFVLLRHFFIEFNQKIEILDRNSCFFAKLFRTLQKFGKLFSFFFARNKIHLKLQFLNKFLKFTFLSTSSKFSHFKNKWAVL